jgi:hypothetical protein
MSPFDCSGCIQHSLKPFTVTCSEMHCHSVMIHIVSIIRLQFLVYNLTEIREDSQFSPQMVLIVFTLYSIALLDKLTSLKLIKKYSTFYGTGKFITAFTSAHHLAIF